jgi:hypothetical protein
MAAGRARSPLRAANVAMFTTGPRRRASRDGGTPYHEVHGEEVLFKVFAKDV